MSSSTVTRCYTPLKTNFYIKTKDQYDEIRRDSFEIDVFQASSYYSGIREAALNYADYYIQDQDEQLDHLSTRRHSINIVRRNDQLEEPKKKKKNKKKKLQPAGSPGAKLATYLHSLLNQTNLLVSKPKKNKPRLFEDDKKSSRSSSMSLARCAADVASVHSCPTYTTSHTRPTPTPKSAHTKPGYRDLRSYSSAISKKSDILLDAETLEAGGGRWPAITWFDQELKIRKGVSYSSVKDLKKVKEEADGGESDSSSDLFELQNHDLRGQGELPVHQTTTNMNNIKARK